MSWIKIGFLGSVVFTLYYLQQIKITLKGKGFDVDMLTGWLTDYRRFKKLILKESEPKSKAGYQGILNGLHLALMGLVIFGSFIWLG
ncbi:MAG: hypothetical protein WBG37_05690 [Desulfobacterales bacterium]